MGDQLAGAGEEGIAGHGERLECVITSPLDICHTAWRLRINFARSRKACGAHFIRGDRGEEARGFIGPVLLGSDPGAHQPGNGGSPAPVFTGQCFELVVSGLQIARFNLVERAHENFGIGLHRLFLATVPEQVSAETDQAEDEHGEQGLAVLREEFLGIALAHRVVDLPQQGFLLGGVTFREFLLAAEFFLGGEGHVWRAPLCLVEKCLRVFRQCARQGQWSSKPVPVRVNGR